MVGGTVYGRCDRVPVDVDSGGDISFGKTGDDDPVTLQECVLLFHQLRLETEHPLEVMTGFELLAVLGVDVEVQIILFRHIFRYVAGGVVYIGFAGHIMVVSELTVCMYGCVVDTVVHIHVRLPVLDRFQYQLGLLIQIISLLFGSAAFHQVECRGRGAVQVTVRVVGWHERPCLTGQSFVNTIQYCRFGDVFADEATAVIQLRPVCHFHVDLTGSRIAAETVVGDL